MSKQVTVLGVRHHGPGSARMVLRALETLKPDAVLIEGPHDANDVLAFAGREEMQPPVALLMYEPDVPSEAAYYPYARFSPEWQAMRWALQHRKEVRFIDLPFSMRLRENEDQTHAEKATAESEEHSAVNEDAETELKANTASMPPALHEDPLDELARAAGFADGEAWWGQLVEEHRGEDDPLGVFDAIREAMASAREELGASRHEKDEPVREAHMRKMVRAAAKDGFENIVVVCGAWHAPMLTAEAIKAHAVKADDELIKARPKRKTNATWIPWTNDRLSASSGYGAGILSPGWYDHLWVHQEKISEHWLAHVARLLRAEGLDASPASVIEAVRLADTLAALRGRAIANLDALNEATLSILCQGNPLPIRVIERKLLIGDCLGAVPDDAPSVPLQRDLAALQKSLRLKVSADDVELDLDLRKETDLARSRLLHRLVILHIGWGTLAADRRQKTSTFHEVWKLQWMPEFAVAVMEAARWGNTVAEAATAFVSHKALNSASLPELTAMLDSVLLADLPGGASQLVSRIQDLATVGADVGHMMEAVPPLARVLRYGDVRKTDAELVEPVVRGIVARVCAGLVSACTSLDDDAASIARGRIDSFHAALVELAQADLVTPWLDELMKLGDADVHGLVAGRAWRLVLDAQPERADDAAGRLSLALSRGNDPAKAAAWLEGFLERSGMILVHDERLLSIVDAWVCSLTRETFEQVCPIARRTFSTFEKPERRHIGQKLARGNSHAQMHSAEVDDYDAERGALVEPVLRSILGELP